MIISIIVLTIYIVNTNDIYKYRLFYYFYWKICFFFYAFKLFKFYKKTYGILK